jgi:hypothetical protein
VFCFKWVLDQGPEQREPKMTVLCLLIFIIIIIYYIIIKLLIMVNHPSRNLEPAFCVFSPSQGQCYKTFYSHELRLFLIS